MMVVIVDTSVWIAYFGHGTGRRCDELDALLDAGAQAALTPTILQEVLRGSQTVERLESLRRRMSLLPVLQPADLVAAHVEAARIDARCRRAGVAPRSGSDCLIVQAALEHRVPLFHDDADFLRIQRVVPRLRLV